MRIIAQDGTDYPYEQLIISTEHNEYMGGYIIRGQIAANVYASNVVMAKYSTEERMQKALRGMYYEYSRYSAIHDSYNYPKYYRFPPDEEIEGENDDA